MFVYHITQESAYNDQISSGFYVPEGYSHDGFIHCSTAKQVKQVAKRFYQGQSGLVVLEIDAEKLVSSPVFENLEAGTELYPHLYEPLPVAAVSRVINLPLNPDQSINFPPIF